MKRLSVSVLGVACALGCGPDKPLPPTLHGERLFHSTALSPSRLNVFSCRSCHALSASEPGASKLPGAPLAGVTWRPSYWGGQELDLLRAIDACRVHFMGATEPLDGYSVDGEALYAYLVSLEPGDSRPAPFTIARAIQDAPRGDAAKGRRVYDQTCARCHGALHSGDGRLTARFPVLPEQVLAEHVEYTPLQQRLVFIEKVRHGGFLGYGGDMPPYSLEVLSDAELSDLLEAMAVVGD